MKIKCIHLAVLACTVTLLSCFAGDAESSNRAEGNANGWWALSADWTGFMGIALEIDGSNFQYFAYSDVKSHSKPVYPVRGLVNVDTNSTILLTVSDDDLVYDKRWRMLLHDGFKCLMAERDWASYQQSGVLDEARLLWHVPARVVTLFRQKTGAPPMNYTPPKSTEKQDPSPPEATPRPSGLKTHPAGEGRE